MRTIILLAISNLFMVAAWYGHLRFKHAPLWLAVIASWGIAFFEYCFQAPANRWGHGQFTAAQLRVIAEVLNIAIFAVFSIWYLQEKFRWNYALAFLFLIAAVIVVFMGREEKGAGGVLADGKAPPPMMRSQDSEAR